MIDFVRGKNMLTRLDLENFKAFKNPVSINLKPITLLFGQNSSGKSSILQSLYLLKQTLDYGHIDSPLLFQVQNGLVDLGGFHQTVHDHDLCGSFSIRLDAEWQIDPGSSPVPLDVDWQEVKDQNTAGIEFTFSWEPNELDSSITEFGIHLGGKDAPVMRFIPVRMQDGTLHYFIAPPYSEEMTDFERSQLQVFRNQVEQSSEENGLEHETVSIAPVFREYDVNSACEKVCDYLDETRKSKRNKSIITFNELSEPCSAAVEFLTSFNSLEYFFPGETVSSSQLYDVAGGLMSEISELAECRANYFMQGYGSVACHWLYGAALNLLEHLKCLRCLSPVRELPHRVYTICGAREIGLKGEHLAEILLRQPEILEQINHWLDRLDIGYAIEVHKLPVTISDYYEMRLMDLQKHNSPPVSVADVGIGVSQLLPIIAQALSCKSSCILVEQPELHIHPALQARLGNLFAESMKQNGNQFIIETHSEHLILRLQRLIRKKDLSNDQIGVYYASRGPNGCQVQELRLDEEGEFIDDWPNGFFAERLREILD